MPSKVQAEVCFDETTCCMSSLSEFDDAVEDALDPES